MRVDELDTPCLVVDVDRMERNLRDMADAAREAGVGLRPHAKTHKSPLLARRQLELGAFGLTLAKIGEAEVFAEAGLADVDTLIAFPIVGEQKVRRLVDLAERGRITVSLDSVEAAEPISTAAHARGTRIDVLLEVEGGYLRVGVDPAAALDVARKLSKLPGIRLRGVMTFEGIAYNGADTEQRWGIVRPIAERLLGTVEALRLDGLECEVVSMGSSPSAKLSMLVKGVTEVRPGTYIFYDANHVRLGICSEDQVAATVHARVVSRATDDRAVVDAGSKALTQDESVLGVNELGLVKGIPHWRLDRASEEHGMLVRRGEGPRLEIGQRLELIPNHACPMVNLFDQMYLARGGEVIDVLPVAARGRSQ